MGVAAEERNRAHKVVQYAINRWAGLHVCLYTAKNFPELVHSLVLTGSSGLYEKAMGDTYPKRGDYEYIKKKAQDVFYDPAVATKEMVDELFKAVNDRNCVIRILALAKRYLNLV